MPYFVVDNFRYGWDSRRSQLASQPGTLSDVRDGHITAGGEVQQRRRFQLHALPAGTFGLAVTEAGLVTFGSGPPPEMGEGVTYQRLQHPEVLAGRTPGPQHDMVRVVGVTTYLGRAFVVAEFADGGRFCYYDGQLVWDFVEGLVLPGLTSRAALAEMFRAAVERQGRYTATIEQGYPERVVVTGTWGQPFTLVATKKTVDGVVTVSRRGDGHPGTAGVSAMARFRIVAGHTGGRVVQVRIGPSLLGLMGDAVEFESTPATTAQRVAAEINQQVSDPEVTAVAVQDEVRLVFASSGATQNGWEVQVECDGPLVVDACSVTFPDTITSITSIKDSNDVELLPEAQTRGSLTLAEFMAAVAEAVNGEEGDYVAVPGANGLWFGRRLASSTDPQVSIIVEADVAGEGGEEPPPPPGQFTAWLDRTHVSGARLVFSPGTYLVTAPGSGNDWPQCFVEGGVPPYTYQWTRVSGSDKVAAAYPSSNTTKFIGNLTVTKSNPFVSVTAAYKCVVQDSQQQVAETGLLVVALSLEYEAG